jgi:PAS domain S-box-containing protein
MTQRAIVAMRVELLSLMYLVDLILGAYLLWWAVTNAVSGKLLPVLGSLYLFTLCYIASRILHYAVFFPDYTFEGVTQARRAFSYVSTLLVTLAWQGMRLAKRGSMSATQHNFPLPTNERERLTALAQYAILDTPSEQAYDDIVTLASQVCETPIALLSLIDKERQWFKAKVGLGSSEIRREDAFCAYTIQTPSDLMIVPDTYRDERFRNNPLVTGDPHIRFYAGAPLVTASGEALGALCVIDRVPRQFTPDQAVALRILARHVMTQLELRRTSRALAEQAKATLEGELKNTTIIETLAEGLIQIEADGTLSLCNEVAEGILGRNKEALQRAWQEQTEEVLAEDGAVFSVADPRLLVNVTFQTGQPQSQVLGITKPDGNFVWVLAKTKLFETRHTSAPALLLTLTEITEQKKAEQQQRTLITTMSEGLLQVEVDGTISFSNPAAERILGSGFEEMHGFRLRDGLTFVSQDGQPLESDDPTLPIAMTFRTGQPQANFVMGVPRVAGGMTWVLVNTQPLKRSAAAQPHAVLATLTDITAQKELDIQQRTLIAVMSEGLVHQNADGKIILCNAAAEAILGLTKEQMLGRDSVDPRWRSVHEDGSDFPGETHPAMVTLQTGETKRDVVMGVHKPSGDLTWILVNSEPLLAPGYLRPHGVVTTFTDITERVRAEQTMLAAKNAAVAASREKTVFLSRMSHELRTPLNAIVGFAQLLELEAISAEQALSAERILEVSKHLLNLMNEIMDVSRIEAGMLTLNVEPTEIVAALDETVNLIHPIALAQGIYVELLIPEDTRLEVLVDAQRLKQIFLNLLSNAIKYNREGGSVTLRCETIDKFLRVEVRDTGRGIPLEKMSRLFTPFERLGAEQTNVEGSGIGLTLTKLLVEAMGGKLTLHSQAEVGTTVRVELPLA